MKSDSFAEILKEQMEKSQNRKANTQFSASSPSPNKAEYTIEANLDLSLFQTQLFQQSPQSFRNHFNSDVKQTPYRQYKAQPKKQESGSTGQFQGKANSQATRAQEPKPAPRVRMAAHKLNPAQTQAMTYFISEKMFLLEDFTKDELKRAYKRLALKKHPDRQSGSNQYFIELQKHYEILSTVPKL